MLRMLRKRKLRGRCAGPKANYLYLDRTNKIERFIINILKKF